MLIYYQEGPKRWPSFQSLYQALHDAYRQRETVFAATMADRDDWEKATVQQRHLAVAADAELRRRHPDEHYPSLRSAEPEPATSDQREELTMTAGEETREPGQRIEDLAAAHRTFAATLADRQSLMIPSPRPGLRRPRPGVPALARTGQGRDLAAAQAGDPPVPAGSPACGGPRRQNDAG